MNTFVPKSTTESQHPKPDRKRPSSRDGLSAATAASLDSTLFDNRPQAIAQRNLQAMAEQGPLVQHLAQLQAMVDNSPRQVAQRKQLEQSFGQPVQRQQGLEEEELQMKAAPDTVQRQSLEDEELLQGKMDPVQRQGELEDEELLQGKFDPVQRRGLEDEELVQGRFAGSEPPMQRQGVADGGENRTGMPDSLKGGLEQLSGTDLSGVRVHHNSAKPAQLNALAYAQGQDIHLGPGQEKHLPHEGWHAVQQMQGRVTPTIQAQGVSINDDEGLEREADVMGAKALRPSWVGEKLFQNEMKTAQRSTEPEKEELYLGHWRALQQQTPLDEGLRQGRFASSARPSQLHGGEAVESPTTLAQVIQKFPIQINDGRAEVTIRTKLGLKLKLKKYRRTENLHALKSIKQEIDYDGLAGNAVGTALNQEIQQAITNLAGGLVPALKSALGASNRITLQDREVIAALTKLINGGWGVAGINTADYILRSSEFRRIYRKSALRRLQNVTPPAGKEAYQIPGGGGVISIQNNAVGTNKRHGGRTYIILDDGISKDRIASLLVHETVHLLHRDNEQIVGQPLQAFKAEFRAYSQAEDWARPVPTVNIAHAGLKNALTRQQSDLRSVSMRRQRATAITKHIIHDYRTIREAAMDPATGDHFKDQIAAFLKDYVGAGAIDGIYNNEWRWRRRV